ncbi:asparaginyl-trna synthetase [Trichoderma arundinaceum]|uniref:asparagine--tRNA ligase n=1 Tax=Trichoderma arundinaceum TaxID=490622 RepID=A0A395NB90_TRIAR|nr:asparaginyl-trna synthetase [Trichoderma arundinaceum]
MSHPLRLFARRYRRCHLPQGRCYSVRVPSDGGGDGQGLDTIRTVADLKEWQPGSLVSDVQVCGWVRSVRKSSSVRFVDITDGSSMRPMQAVVDKSLAADIRPGAAVRLKGVWHSNASKTPPNVDSQGDSLDRSSVAGTQLSAGQPSSADGNYRSERASASPSSPASNAAANLPGEAAHAARTDNVQASVTAELRVNEVEILGASNPQTYPIQNKYQTPESLRAISHLRPRTPINSTLLRLRSDAMAILSQFFFHEKFQQTHPPIITSSDCEGAGEAFTVKSGGASEFFRDPKYLTVSSQLHLEALAQALGNVWTLSPTFRAEQSDTSRHLSEFYMLEAEMSFVQDMDEVMDLAQRMLASLASGLQQRSAAQELEKHRLDSRDPAERLAFEDLVDLKELRQRWRGLMAPARWPRVTYTEAINILEPVAHMFEHKPVWGSGLQSEHEKYLAEKIGYDEASDAYLPIFVTQYPRDIKAFYMLQSAAPPPQGQTVDCFDLLAPNLGELAGGSMREHRLAKLEDNMRLHGLEVPTHKKARSNDMGWYLDLRRWGCPPHGGFGLGFDRLLSYLTGVPNVRDVVPFPRHFERCDC